MALIPVIPPMTSNTAPSGTCSASSTYGGSACGGHMQPFNLFDRNPNTLWMTDGVPSGWNKYVNPTPQLIAAYSVTGAGGCAEGIPERIVKSWTLSLDGVVVDTQTNGPTNGSIIMLGTAILASAFMLTVTANGGNSYSAVTAFQVYTDDGTSPPPPTPDGDGFTVPARVVFPLPALPSSDLLAGTVPAIPPLEGYSAQYYDVLVATQNAAQTAMSANGGAVFVLGDSIVTTLDVRQIPGGFNAGIGSDSFAGVLGRMAGYTALHNAHAIVLLCGHNNAYFGQSLATMQDHFARIVNWRTGRFVWVPIPPSTAAHADVMVAFNTWAAAYLAEMPNVAIADLTGFDPSTDTVDGTHPNATGAAKLSAAILAALAELE